MTKMTVEATLKNTKIASKYHVSVSEFCGYLTIEGDTKIIKKLARKMQVLI